MLSVKANFNAWKVRICSIFRLSLSNKQMSHHFSVHNTEIHLNANSEKGKNIGEVIALMSKVSGTFQKNVRLLKQSFF